MKIYDWRQGAPCFAIALLSVALGGSAKAESMTGYRPPTPIRGGAVLAIADSTPSLEETLGFIRDKIAQQGRINYAGRFNDPTDNQNWINQFSVEASKVTVDAPACAVRFHWATAVDGKPAQDFDTSIQFGAMDGQRITSMEEDTNHNAAVGGHPAWVGTISPSVWVLTSRGRDGRSYVVDFEDRDMADRVSRAMDHARELCGGKSKEPF
jgi:hypothetical protein